VKFCLIRHPRPCIAPGLCYGRLDVPLAEPPECVAERLQANLPPLLAELPCFTSPAHRCRMLAAALHPAPVIDARLQELNFGAWEGQAWETIGSAALDAWARDPVGFAPPGGESAREVLERALDFIREIEQKYRAMPPVAVVCVTHGGILRVLSAWRHALPPTQWADLQFDYEAVLTLDFNETFRAVSVV